MVLGDAASKLETFVWIFNHVTKVRNLVSVRPKSIKLGQMANLDVIFQVMVQIWNSPQLTAQFCNGL